MVVGGVRRKLRQRLHLLVNGVRSCFELLFERLLLGFQILQNLIIV